MKQSNSSSPTPANQEQPDWKEVLFEVILKILTLGFYHVKKHKGN